MPLGLSQAAQKTRHESHDRVSMDEGLNRDEDTALRCLAALTDAGPLSPEHSELMEGLRARDRRSTIRREGSRVPASTEVEAHANSSESVDQ